MADYNPYATRSNNDDDQEDDTNHRIPRLSSTRNRPDPLPPNRHLSHNQNQRPAHGVPNDAADDRQALPRQRTRSNDWEDNGGRYYEDETWASSETPAAFLSRTGASSNSVDTSPTVAFARGRHDPKLHASHALFSGGAASAAGAGGAAAGAAGGGARGRGSEVVDFVAADDDGDVDDVDVVDVVDIVDDEGGGVLGRDDVGGTVDDVVTPYTNEDRRRSELDSGFVVASDDTFANDDTFDPRGNDDTFDDTFDRRRDDDGFLDDDDDAEDYTDITNGIGGAALTAAAAANADSTLDYTYAHEGKDTSYELSYGSHSGAQSILYGDDGEPLLDSDGNFVLGPRDDGTLADNNDDGNNDAVEELLPEGVTSRDRQEDAMMRLLAHQLNRDWDGMAQRGKAGEAISPSLERRLRDFRFAENKRRDRYGGERPWGILGLYDHLQGVRIDVEWAEDAAWRRDNDEPYLSWSDFENSRNSGFNRPWFTYFILVVCTGVLIASIGVNGWSIEPLNVNPMIGPSAQTLVIMGAKQTSLIVVGGEWYRLFTPMFLHAGLIHYLLNMLALWFIGSAVEQSHGFVSAAIIFVISAVGGNILSAIFLPEYISVGASGGIFGLIGACIADIAINWNLLFSKQVNQTDEGTRLRHVKVLIWLVFDILINCLVGLTPFVDNFTHLGGMLYGFLCGLSTIERLPLDFFGTPHDSCARIRNYAVRFFGLILSVILIMISTAVLVESDGGTSPCSNCRYVSCVPFPFWASEEDKWWYCDDCDKVTADATPDATGYFAEMIMTCPNGSIETIDLSGQDIKDREWLAGQLPTFCRKNCDSLFAR